MLRDLFAVTQEMSLQIWFILRWEGAALNKISEKSLPSYSTAILLDLIKLHVNHTKLLCFHVSLLAR
jgi:hypothetical protein